MTKSGETIEISIDELAAGGDGVGRDPSGRVTFVPYGVPGDRLSVELIQVRKDFARARIAQVLTPSPHRGEAVCKYFNTGRCGGCQWQHVTIEEQRRSKAAMVAGALRKLVAAGLVIEPLLTPVSDLHWRRRARLHWFRAPASTRAELGFFAPRSQFVTDIDDCVQLTERLAAALETARTHLRGALHGRGTLHLLESEDGVHLAIDGACRPKAAEALAASEGIAGVRLGEQVLGRSAVSVDGGDAAADDFAQATDAGNRELVRVVDEVTAPWRTGARVLELFAGSGNLTAALSGADVVAVERRPGPGRAGVDWRVGDAAAITSELAEAGERFDALVLDPPRQGAKEVIATAAALTAQHVVYVSCNPATLARDAQVLIEAGFSPRRAHPIDLMPQTSHVEVIVSFSR